MQSRVAPKSRIGGAESSEFCHPCNSSTRHTGEAGNRTCVRCGAKKNTPVVHHKPEAKKESFEIRLNRALGINEEADAPKQFKSEGESKTSQAGAHRPDKGVKFTQMRYDDQFQHKGDYKQLKA